MVLVHEAMRVAIHDLGSHTFHLLCARVEADGELVPELTRRHALRLGASVIGGCIPDDACQRALAAADDLASAARVFAGDTYAVGTSVLRETGNGAALATSIGERLGVPVRLLSGAEEADLVFAGARSELPGLGTIAVVDLGGGSLEIAVGDDRVRYARSLPLGALKLRGLVGEDLVDHVHDAGGATWHEVKALAPQAIVLTGGSARMLAKLAGTPRLDAVGIDALARRLAELDDPARRGLGVPDARIDTIAPAAGIFAVVIDRLGGVAQVSSRGLREGFVLRAAGK